MIHFMFKGYILKSAIVENAKRVSGEDIFDVVFKEISNKPPSSLLKDYKEEGNSEKEKCLRLIFIEHPDLLKMED